MNLDFTGNGLQDIAALVAGLLALSLALQTAVGPTVMMLTEALKAAFNFPTGKGGILAILVGVVIGLCIGFLTAIVAGAGTAEYVGLALCGAFAGLFMGAGAVQAHKAAGAVNTEASAAIETSKIADSLAANQMSYDYASPSYGTAMAYNIPATGYDAGDTDTDFEEGDTDHDTELNAIIQAGPGDDPTTCDCTPNHTDSDTATAAKTL